MENQEDRSTNKARVAWLVSLNLTSVIWLLVLLIIVAGAEEKLIAADQSQPSTAVTPEAPLDEP